MTNAIFTGLMLGGMYALIAMGLTLQYGVARIMNLSYGEFLVAAACSRRWCAARRRATHWRWTVSWPPSA
jgi:branched-chain amino acid transport system permease protein